MSARGNVTRVREDDNQRRKITCGQFQRRRTLRSLSLWSSASSAISVMLRQPSNVQCDREVIGLACSEPRQRLHSEESHKAQREKEKHRDRVRKSSSNRATFAIRLRLIMAAAETATITRSILAASLGCTMRQRQSKAST